MYFLSLKLKQPKAIIPTVIMIDENPENISAVFVFQNACTLQYLYIPSSSIKLM